MQDTVRMVADLMVLAARTAPKALGQDFLVMRVVQGADLDRLGNEMAAYGLEKNRKDWDRDGDNVRRSDAVLLIGLKEAKTAGLNCGACGQDRCEDLTLREGTEFAGPLCAWRLLDLGIAVGSAVKTASMLNVDNRVMYRVGVVARRMGLIPAEIALGIPLSATGKSIYFDRPSSK